MGASVPDMGGCTGWDVGSEGFAAPSATGPEETAPPGPFAGFWEGPFVDLDEAEPRLELDCFIVEVASTGSFEGR